MIPKRAEVVHGQDYEVRVLGAPAAGPRDAYHWLLTVPWWAAITLIVCSYLFLNVLFALAYLASGGIVNVELIRSRRALAAVWVMPPQGASFRS